MPTKKLNWYYDFIECTLHTILNGYYMDFSVNIYFCIFPCHCIVILETFFSSLFLFLLCPSLFLLRFHLSSNSFAPVARSIAQPSSCSYAMNYESNPKCVRWNLFIRFIHTTNLAQSEYGRRCGMKSTPKTNVYREKYCRIYMFCTYLHP